MGVHMRTRVQIRIDAIALNYFLDDFLLLALRCFCGDFNYMVIVFFETGIIPWFAWIVLGQIANYSFFEAII